MKRTKFFIAILLSLLILFQSVVLSNVSAVENDIYAKMVTIANQEVGYLETTYSDGTFSSKYGEWYGNPNGAWCAMFVSWCANHAGISTETLPKFASCNAGMQWFKNKNLWKERNEYTPQPGDLVFLNECTHVGIVEKYDDGIVYTIEGNASDENKENYGVRKRVYSSTSSKITGYGTPDKSISSKLNGKATKTETAYMLPNTSSQTVWEVWENDDLEILCKDGNFYLVMYPFLNTGKFVCAYVSENAISAYKTIPDASNFYDINKDATVVNSNTYLYHNPSDSSLMSNANVDKKVRATLDIDTKCQVLFEKEGYYFIKTENGITGFTKATDIIITNNTVPTQNPTNTTNKIGDADNDGSITIKDATLTQSFVAHSISEDAINLNSADVDADKILTIKDATLIQEYVAKLISVFPNIPETTPTEPTKIDVDAIQLPDNMEVIVGESLPISYEIVPNNATDKSIFWMSADDGIASVSDDGVITANSVGNTKLFAVSSNGIKATMTVYVVDRYIPVENISINNPNTSPVNSGTDIQLTANITPNNATDKRVLWSSSNPDVASVDENGKVTAKTAGTVTITATDYDKRVQANTTIKINQVLTYIPNGTYCLKLKNTNSYLDHQGGNANGTNIHLWNGDGNSNANQKIKIERIDDSRYKLWSAVSTNLMVDVNRGSSYSDPLKIGLNIDLWENNDWEAQEWFFTKTYDGYYIIRLNMIQEGAIESDGTSDGANIFYGAYNYDNDMQKWELINTSDYIVPETPAWIYNTQDIGNVNVRSGPGTNYASIGGFNEGQQITVIGNTNDTWLKVRGANRHNGEIIQGYTHRDYIKFDPKEAETIAWIYNTQDVGNVNVRSGPGTNYASIGGFNEGQQITVIGSTTDTWLKVSGANRHNGEIIQGYTHRDYITFVKPTYENTFPGAEAAISWATSQLGNQSYNYWCLKFVGDAFRQGGVGNAGYSTATIAGNAIITHTDSNPPRGAVVFYDWYGSIDGVYQNYGHVGISLGNGQVIHADYNGVKITNLNIDSSRKYRGWGQWK